MKIIIQIAVIVVALIVIIVALAGRQSYAARAWKKLALVLLAIAMVIAVLFPSTTNTIAHLFGVGRGADLLLYVLAVTFIGYVINSYLHQQREKDTLIRLARKIAVLDANERYSIRRK